MHPEISPGPSIVTIFLDDYSDPSDYVHTFGLEHCWRVEGNCRSTLIKITVNDPCDVACEPPIIDECDVPAIPGCMNPESANYNPNATVDDGSCIICPDYNYEINKFSNDGGASPNGEFTLQVQGVDLSTVETQANGVITLTEGSIGHYLVTVTPLEGGSIPTVEGLGTEEVRFSGLEDADYKVTIIPNVDAFKNVCRKEFIVTIDGNGDGNGDGGGDLIPGCTDSLADNYNASATVDDGSCTYCSNFAIVIDSQTNPTWDGASDGSIQISTVGGSGDFSFVIDDSAGFNMDANALPTGTFTITATDNVYGSAACTATTTFTLEAAGPNPCTGGGTNIGGPNPNTGEIPFGQLPSSSTGNLIDVRYKWELNVATWCPETTVQYEYQGEIYQGVFGIRIAQYYEYYPYLFAIPTEEMHLLSVVSITNLTTPGQFVDTSQIGGPFNIQETTFKYFFTICYCTTITITTFL